MKPRDYILKVAPRALWYAAARRGWAAPINPLTLTFSVTAACQGQCKTCRIGETYRADPSLVERNLSLDEIDRAFRSLGSVYFLNISGGEPFLRDDLAEIIRLGCVHLKPRLIHIPTNAISPPRVAEGVVRILDAMDAHAAPSVPLTVKPSIDGVGEAHERIRGVQGNFASLEKTIHALLEIRRTRPRLHVDLGTVISTFNIDALEEVEDWVHARGVESYRHEIAEQRAEFHNLGDPITPAPEAYAALTRRFREKILGNIRGKALLTRMTEAVRLVYYDLAVDILKQRRQVTPCYGGLSNIHMNYDGEVWPCCVLGGEQSFGNVRDWDCDMQAVLRSEQARRARAYIAAGACACPLANQWLNNILLTPRHMVKVLYALFVLFPLARLRRPGLGREPAGAPDGQVEAGPVMPPQVLVQERLGAIPAPTEAAAPLGGPDARTPQGDP